MVGREGQEGVPGVDGVPGKDGSKGMPVRLRKLANLLLNNLIYSNYTRSIAVLTFSRGLDIHYNT